MDRFEKHCQFWTLNITAFLGQLGIAMINLTLVYFLKEKFQASASIVGCAASTYTICYLLGCLLGGRRYQRIKPRHMVEISTAGMVLSIVAFSFVSSLGEAFFCLVFYGLFMSMLWPQLEAWIVREKDGRELGVVTSAFNFSWSCGIGISSYFATFLISFESALGLWGGIWVLCSICILIWIVSSTVPGIRMVDSEESHIRKAQEGREDHSTPLRFYSWFSLFFVYFVLSVILNIFPLYASDYLGFSEQTCGLLLLVRGMSTCMFFLIFGKFTWWQFKAWVIFVVEGLLAVLCLVFSTRSSVVSFGIFFLLFGILVAFSYSNSIFHGVVGALNRNDRMVILEVVLTAGTVFGALIGGGIYQHYGFPVLLFGLGCLSGVGVLMQLSFFCRQKRLLCLRTV